MEFKTKNKAITNYLDDFLFAAITKMLCNFLIQEFLSLCSTINLPVALEKMEWATTLIVFLDILLDEKRLLLSIPLEKQEKALKLLNDITGKKKMTVKQLQVLTGYLNFLTKAIHSGRTFTRRMYAKYTGLDKKLKQHHHVAIDREFRFDCEIWRVFLVNCREAAVCRPMLGLNIMETSEQLDFSSDASGGEFLGFGTVYENRWLFAQWESGYIKQPNGPTIEYLELYALTTAVLTWGPMLQNKRVVIYCDNQAVVGMINKSSSSFKNCMYSLRLLILDNLIHNRRISAKYIRSQDNKFSDALSRLDFDRFWSLAGDKMDKIPYKISELVWPASKIWNI